MLATFTQTEARAENASLPAGASRAPHALGAKTKILSPDARRFLAPSMFAWLAGGERVFDGELTPAAPRAFDGRGFLPALDDHTTTTTYARTALSSVRRGDASWASFDLASIHEFRGGAVLGTDFRIDARERTAVQAFSSLMLPLPKKLFLMPTVGLGAGSFVASEVHLATELRTDREKPLGFTFGLEASKWNFGHDRGMVVFGCVHRFGRVALEQRLALGAWTGPRLGGDIALRWTSSALQTLPRGFALYERVTLARGPLYAAGAVPDRSATSVDVAIGFRHPIAESFGFLLQAEAGGQLETYQRGGGEVALYGTLF